MKKRVIGILLVLVMALSFVPTMAMAEPIEEGIEKTAEAAGYTLASLEKAIVDAALQGESSVNVRAWKVSTDQMDTVLLRIQSLYPELFYAYIQNYRYDPSSNNRVSYVLISYDSDADAMKAEMNSALNRIYAELDDQNIQRMSDTEKALCIHDYLCANVCYSQNVIYNWCYSAYGPLVKGTGVCQGYAEAYMLLGRHYGLTCGIVTSGTIGHAWNVIRLNGSWYHMDITWDDPTWDMLGRARHTYCLLTESELLNIQSSRRDMVIRTLPEDTYSGNASAITGFWKNTNCRCYYDGSSWYYLDTSNHLVRTNLSGSDQKVLTSGTYRWRAGGNSYWASCYGQMFGMDGKIYYSTPNQIRQYVIASGTDSIYATPQLPSDNLIYGMGLQKGQIVYALETSPNFSHDQTYLSMTLPACTTHRYRSETVAATCTAGGYTTYTCTRCGYSYKGNYTNALGHDWGTGKVTKEATVSSSGIRTYTCSHCKKTKTETIPKLLATPVLTGATLAPNGVTVKWNAVPGAEKYRVFYKTATSGWNIAADVTGSSYTVTGLTSGTKYTFTVRCVSADGKTYTSGFNATGKTVTYIAAPIIKSLGTSVKGVEVKWNAVPGAVNYAVFYKTASGSWTKAGTTTAGSYTVTGLTSGTNYTFTVRCMSKDGKSYTSAFDSVGKNFTYLSTPAVSSAALAPNGVTVKWAPVSGAERYRVFYKSGSGNWVTAGDTTGSSYTITGLTSGTAYTFTIRCVSADGKTYTSGFNATGKTVTYIAAPIIKSLGTSVKGVEVKWNAVGGAYRYAVFYKTATVGWTYAGQTTAGSYTVTGLTSGTHYTFTVRCLSKDGKSYTSAFDAVGKDFTYLSTPTVSSATKSGTSAVISWGAVNGAESYRVFYKISGTSTWVSVGNTTDTTMIVPNLKAGTTYIFTVRCTDAAGTVYTSGFDSTGKTLKL